MNEYFKFPSTQHLVLPKEEHLRKDKVMPVAEIEELLMHKIVIEEKVDGANLGISFDGEGNLILQNRGELLKHPFEGQWRKLGHWVEKKQEQLFDVLLDRYILFGEWCYAAHSVYYNKLPDYFIGFDLFDKEKKKFFSVERRNKMLERMGIFVIHSVATGRFQLEELPLFFSESHYGNNLCEGIYIRWDENGWLKKRAKLVRHDFRQTIEEHWTKKGIRINGFIQEKPPMHL